MNRSVPIVKMSGAGNDFVVLDEATWVALPTDRVAWVRGVCRRGVSVGADGVLVVSRAGPARVHVTFLNPDGGEAFCGNGSRCAARYAVSTGIAEGPAMTLLTQVGEIGAVIEGGAVTLTLPPPRDHGEIALAASGEEFRARFVWAGVPHLVVRVSGLRDWPIHRFGPALRSHPAVLPEGANVNFAESDERDRIHVRTWERGVEAETLACGTGALAVAFAARLAGAGETMAIVPRSGIPLSVDLPGDPRHPASARLTGDARFVFEGVVNPEGIAWPP